MIQQALQSLMQVRKKEGKGGGGEGGGRKCLLLWIIIDWCCAIHTHLPSFPLSLPFLDLLHGLSSAFSGPAHWEERMDDQEDTA